MGYRRLWEGGKRTEKKEWCIKSICNLLRKSGVKGRQSKPKGQKQRVRSQVVPFDVYRRRGNHSKRWRPQSWEASRRASSQPPPPPTSPTAFPRKSPTKIEGTTLYRVFQPLPDKGDPEGPSKVSLGPVIHYHSMPCRQSTSGRPNSRPGVSHPHGKCTIQFQGPPRTLMKYGPVRSHVFFYARIYLVKTSSIRIMFTIRFHALT
jgi:hypothetical protein